MKKITIITALLMSMSTISIASNHDRGQPENPGIDGQSKAFFTEGFQKVVADKGLVAATYLFGNKGKGNGADPDPLGLADDHDPGSIGGEPDTTR